MSEGEESDCSYYDQCLGFEDDSTVTALAIGVLIVDIFLFIASLWHRQSNLEHLLFITSRYYLYFYFFNLVNFLAIIISVTFFNYTATYSQISVGVTLQLTALSTMLINVIGCKYYRSYLCMKKLSLRALVFIGISSLFIFTIIGSVLLYLSVFDKRQDTDIDRLFDWFLFFELLVTVIHTSIASFASKLAQVEWILLMIFTVLYVESYFTFTYEPFNLFLIYWHPILLCCISVATVFGLSPFSKLRYIGVGIFSCFIAMFDLVTDINVIYVWITKGQYIWAGWQTLFIVAGVTFSGVYVKDYYGFVKIDDSQQQKKPLESPVVLSATNTSVHNDNTSDDYDAIKSQASMSSTHPSHVQSWVAYVPSQKVQTVGQICTFIGLGRLWHGFLGWDSEKNKDMLVSNQILKVWEMIFESMPTLVLQFYILLLSEESYDLSVMLSMLASATSVTFTLLYVLYGDHHSLTRKQDLNVGLLKLKSTRMLEDFGDLRFSHRNVLALTMKGHSPARIDRAWSAVKMTDEHKYMNEDDPEFEDVMVQQLTVINEEDNELKQDELEEPTQPSMNAPRPMHIRLQIPSIPSMNAPMISVTVNGQPQSQPARPNAGVLRMNQPQAPMQYVQPVQYGSMPQQYMAHQMGSMPHQVGSMPMYGQPQPMMNYSSVPNQIQTRAVFHQPTMSAHSSAPMSDIRRPPMRAVDSERTARTSGTSTPVSVVQLASPQKEYPDSEFGSAASVHSTGPAMSDIDYKEKKNRINWRHPYILHLKDLGWSKTQIQSAYFILKNNTGDEVSKARSKLKFDDDKFLASMIHILVTELQYTAENPQRQFSDTSECIDKMYQNFVCCLCCRICTKITDDTCCCSCIWSKKSSNSNERGDKKEDFTMKDNIFYFGMYVFVVTDFYCRIFPLLAYAVLISNYTLAEVSANQTLNGFIGFTPVLIVISAFELGSYYFMLKGMDKSIKVAVKYFWTGTYTVAYYVLSTMRLTYIPSNVDFVKLYKAHGVRMVIQLVIMFVALGMQYLAFNDPLGFFNYSVMLFGAQWLLNLLLLLLLRCYMNTFVTKIKDAL